MITLTQPCAGRFEEWFYRKNEDLKNGFTLYAACVVLSLVVELREARRAKHKVSERESRAGPTVDCGQWDHHKRQLESPCSQLQNDPIMQRVPHSHSGSCGKS